MIGHLYVLVRVGVDAIVELLYFAAKGLNPSFQIHRTNGYYLVFEMSQTVQYKINERLNKKKESRYYK